MVEGGQVVGGGGRGERPGGTRRLVSRVRHRDPVIGPRLAMVAGAASL